MMNLYLEDLEREVDSSAVKDFKNIESLFKNYTRFDKINFKIIHDYLLEDIKEDLFISIPEHEYRPNFFSSIFNSILLIKIYQNYFHHSETYSQLQRDDLIITKQKGEFRVMVVKGLGPEYTRVNYKFPRGNERNAPDLNYSNLRILTKINPEIKNTRNTGANVEAYYNYLKNAFGDTFPFITEFKSRTLIIAEKDFFLESRFLPVNYTNRNGKIAPDLPFFNNIIECCTDIEVAKKHILVDDTTFDEVVIIGDAKYIDKFHNILNEKWNGRYKKIVCIGSNLPDKNNEFLKWLWSVDEVKYANGEKPNLPSKIKISNPELYEILNELRIYLNDVLKEEEIDLSFILKYTNFYFRTIFINNSFSRRYLLEYSSRLQNYFESENFEREFSQSFYKNNFYDIIKIGQHKENITGFFNRLLQELSHKNLKWEQIIKLSKNQKRVFVLAEKKNFNSLTEQISKSYLPNVTVISDKKIDSVKPTLDSWLRSAQNSRNALLIIPYLNNIDLYNCLKNVNGQCKILSYEGIDEIIVDKIHNNFINNELTKLSDTGRKKFFSAEYEKIIEEEFRDLDSLFQFNINDTEFRNDPYESIDLPKDKLFYEIRFSDHSSEKFESSKGVFRIEGENLFTTTIGEVFVGDKIRFYQNTGREDFRKILEIFDENKLLSHFDKYALEWKATLRKIEIKEGNIERAYQKLYDKSNKINLVTFKNYFNRDTETRFPRRKTLAAIKNYCERNGMLDELIVKEFNLFLQYSSKDHSLRQQAGRVLGNDMLEYVASEKTEKSATLMKLSADVLDKLVATVKEKTIKEKLIIENE
ncbi:hypothetical protein [Kaistella daneshvariae]|nr:hypothetical protein [Kaistella daneshvariae]